jgi:acyl dehydratase
MRADPAATPAQTTVGHPVELVGLVGATLGTSPWYSIDQEGVDTFADVTHDRQWIHNDVERAAEGPFGATIAHGYMTLSLCSPFLADVLEIRQLSLALNYGLDRVRFPSPVPVGARVRGRARILTAAGIPGGVQVVVRMTVDAEGGEKPVCVADLVVRYYA